MTKLANYEMGVQWVVRSSVELRNDLDRLATVFNTSRNDLVNFLLTHASASLSDHPKMPHLLKNREDIIQGVLDEYQDRIRKAFQKD